MPYHRQENIIKAFGENVKRIRKSKGISQEELAGRADLTLSQVGRIERGVINTSISMVYILAKALGVEPYELLLFELPNHS